MRKAYNTEKKNTKKRKKKFNIFNLLVVAFIVYFVYTVYDQQLQINKYDSQIDMYKADIESKNELVEYYASQKSSIESDEYIESVARDTLGYVKPYEKIFVDANK